MATPIDCVIDQANRYDKTNIQFEKDVLFNIERASSKILPAVLSKVTCDMNTQLRIEQFIQNVRKIFTSFNNAYFKLIDHKFSEYYKTAYENTGDLIDIGNEVSNNYEQSIGEMQQYSEDTINIVKKHAFELLTGYSESKINEIKSTLVDMMLRGTATKANVRSMLEKKLKSTRSKAEEIAQTELSRIYNTGITDRFKEYKRITGNNVKKYWHGFAYSPNTCPYCLERIGNVYDIDDDSESLPAHPRCRCAWLPILDDWDSSARNLITKANMVNTAYSIDMIYQRIKTRLDIDYADYIPADAARDYINGKRSTAITDALMKARQRYISDTIANFNISPDTSNSTMSNEFNNQMSFWKSYIAKCMADNDYDSLYNSVEAIKGVMLLPWTVDQTIKWNDLISKIPLK